MDKEVIVLTPGPPGNSLGDILCHCLPVCELFKVADKIKITMRYHLTLVRVAIIKKSTNNKLYRWYGVKGTFLHC